MNIELRLCRTYLLVLIYVTALLIFAVASVARAQDAPSPDQPPKGALSVSPNMVELILKPGEVYSGSIAVDNLGTGPLSIDAYLGDWTHTQANLELRSEIGTHPRSLGSWMQLSPHQLNIAPEQSKRVYYKISVPSTAKLTGSYWGVLFVGQNPVAQQFEADGTGQDGEFAIGIRLLMRFAIIIYVTIENTEIRTASFESSKIGFTEGKLSMTATVANQGNTYLRPVTWLELRDSSGATVYTEEHVPFTVLPGLKREVSFELRELNIPQGRYTALIIADYDAPNLIAAQAEIEIKGK
jgi:hypothetical protein